MRKRIKTLVGFMAGIAVVIFAVLIVAKNFHKASAISAPPAASQSNSQAIQPQPTAPTPKMNSPTKRTNPKVYAAVLAAAQATDNLAESQLMPITQMRITIEQTVVPSEWTDFEAAYPSQGADLATTQWGYSNINTAWNYAGYYVATQMYKVGSFNSTQATIWLYTVTHWITAKNWENKVPAISIVHMQKIGRHWLFVDASNPPAGQAPVPISNLTYNQAVQRFTPYLKGFLSYASSP